MLFISILTPFNKIASAANTTNSVLETLQVPSDGSRVSSTIALQNGVNYEIVVSGIYYTGTPIQNNQADAMYASHDQWVTHVTDQSGLYIDSWNLGSKQWGDYNSNHIYRYSLAGNGSQVNFWIYSSSYHDNSGSLTIQILGSIVAPQSPTPGPTPTPTAPTQTPIISPTMSPSNSPSNSPTVSASPTGTISPTQIAGFPLEYEIAIAIIAVIIVVVILAVILRKRKP